MCLCLSVCPSGRCVSHAVFFTKCCSYSRRRRRRRSWCCPVFVIVLSWIWVFASCSAGKKTAIAKSIWNNLKQNILPNARARHKKSSKLGICCNFLLICSGEALPMSLLQVSEREKQMPVGCSLDVATGIYYRWYVLDILQFSSFSNLAFQLAIVGWLDEWYGVGCSTYTCLCYF